METREDILARLRELKPALRRDFAVRQIGLFGSFSTGMQAADSDIDILVELERPIGWRFLTLELYLEGIFQRKIDLVTPNALKEAMKEQVLRQVHFA